MRASKAAILGILLAVSSSSAYSFDLNIAIKAGGEVFSQLSNKVTNKIVNGNGENLEEEYNKYQAKVAGYDPAFREKMKAQFDAGWDAMENAILSKNASINPADEAPFLDLKKVGGAAVSGLADTFAGGMGGVATMNTSAGFADLVGYSAINGVGDALSGREQSVPVSAYNFSNMPGGIGSLNALNSGTRSALSDVTGKASSGVANKVIGNFGGSSTFKLTKSMDPNDFFGKSFKDLQSKDLYAMNGYYGFKRVQLQDGFQVYRFIQNNHPVIRTVTYGTDPSTKEVISAFKELSNVEPLKFNDMVDAVAKKKDAKPIFANNENMVRAVWSDGTFVAADTAKVITGWSKSSAAMYNRGYQEASK